MKNDRFEKFWNELSHYDLSKPLSATAINYLTSQLSQCFGKEVAKTSKLWARKAATDLTAAYRRYQKDGYKKYNKNLVGWRLKELKEKFRRELKKRLKLNAELIAPYKGDMKKLVEKRFIGAMSGGKVSVKDLKSMLKLSATLKSQDKKVSNTLKDQKMKMISEFGRLTAEQYGALGFEWSTRDDNLVAGNPYGEYPKVSNPKIHGNHYERDGKVFLFKNSWAVKKGYINKAAANGAASGGEEDTFQWAEDIEDGLPGMPINCRCEALYIYTIEELADDFYLEDCLTEEGKQYLERRKVGI